MAKPISREQRNPASMRSRVRRGMRAFLRAALIATLLLATISPADAYENYGRAPCRWVNWWWGVSVDYRFDATLPDTSTWRSVVLSGATAWTDAPVRPTYNYSSNSWNAIGLDYSPSVPAYGRTFYVCNGSNITSWAISFNTYLEGNLDYFGKRHIAAHELGHGLGLGHSSYWAVQLDWYPANASPYIPTLDDHEAVNLYYP